MYVEYNMYIKKIESHVTLNVYFIYVSGTEEPLTFHLKTYLSSNVNTLRFYKKEILASSFFFSQMLSLKKIYIYLKKN